jgi:hypothetical protein
VIIRIDPVPAALSEGGKRENDAAIRDSVRQNVVNRHG